MEFSEATLPHQMTLQEGGLCDQALFVLLGADEAAKAAQADKVDIVNAARNNNLEEVSSAGSSARRHSLLTARIHRALAVLHCQLERFANALHSSIIYCPGCAGVLLFPRESQFQEPRE